MLHLLDEGCCEPRVLRLILVFFNAIFAPFSRWGHGAADDTFGYDAPGFHIRLPVRSCEGRISSLADKGSLQVPTGMPPLRGKRGKGGIYSGADAGVHRATRLSVARDRERAVADHRCSWVERDAELLL